MPTITIRRLDETTKSRLRVRAAQNGRSMEEEAREILKGALTRDKTQPTNLVDSIRAKFAPLGGVDLPVLPREPVRRPPKLRR